MFDVQGGWDIDNLPQEKWWENIISKYSNKYISKDNFWVGQWNVQ